MKLSYPEYKNKKRFEEVYNSLSEHNQKIIIKFIEYCSITACSSSLKKHRAKIIQIADIFGKDLDKFTLDEVRKFLALLNHSGRATATRNDIVKTLKRFIRFQYKDWNKKFDSLKDAKMSSGNEGRKINKSDLLTADEMQMIINSIDSLRYKTIFLIMQETANRPEELLKLKWKDINFEEKEIKLHSSKTGQTRTIPVNESIAHLKRYKEECFYPVAKNDDYVFPTPNNKEKHITTQTLSDFLLKLEDRLKFKKHLYPYLWRHSVLSSMIKKLSPKVYEMYSGHNLEMGMKTYAHLDTEDLKDELMNKVYHIEELTLKDKSEIQKLKKHIESQQKQINSLMNFENTAMKIGKENNQIMNLLIRKIGPKDKELFEEILQIKNKK